MCKKHLFIVSKTKLNSAPIPHSFGLEGNLISILNGGYSLPGDKDGSQGMEAIPCAMRGLWPHNPSPQQPLKPSSPRFQAKWGAWILARGWNHPQRAWASLGTLPRRRQEGPWPWSPPTFLPFTAFQSSFLSPCPFLRSSEHPLSTMGGQTQNLQEPSR